VDGATAVVEEGPAPAITVEQGTETKSLSRRKSRERRNGMTLVLEKGKTVSSNTT
jgi:hypothetical protein